MSYATIKTQLLTILKLIADFKDSYVASTLSFDATTKRINDSASGLAFIVTDDVIAVSGSTSNNGVFRVTDGGQADYVVVSEDLVNENAGQAVTIAAPIHVTHGDYSLFDKGVGNFLVLVPGPVGKGVIAARSSYRSWVLYGDLFIKYSSESAAWESLVTVRSSVIDQLEKYPMLNNTTGITKIEVSADEDPSGVFDSQNQGPFWLTQRFRIVVTGRSNLSGGDFS